MCAGPDADTERWMLREGCCCQQGQTELVGPSRIATQVSCPGPAEHVLNATSCLLLPPDEQELSETCESARLAAAWLGATVANRPSKAPNIPQFSAQCLKGVDEAGL